MHVVLYRVRPVLNVVLCRAVQTPSPASKDDTHREKKLMDKLMVAADKEDKVH